MRLDHITSRRFTTSLDTVDGRALTARYVPPMPAGAEMRRGNSLSSDNSCVEPPDPIPNSEVKRTRADGSVA